MSNLNLKLCHVEGGAYFCSHVDWAFESLAAKHMVTVGRTNSFFNRKWSFAKLSQRRRVICSSEGISERPACLRALQCLITGLLETHLSNKANVFM